ncbi:MAG: formate dehydrogenase subunit gamma [Burkholderiales bacterium]|nr:formate dehydrogenase subunit gamma [Burkholderiales bacterium]
MRPLLLAAGLAAVLVLPPALARAQATAPDAAQPASASALPRPDDTEARRALVQPGNNAPLWRAVRRSGDQAGVSTLPGAEQGVLIQRFVQLPGSRGVTAGEAWRELRNRWLLPYGGALLLVVLGAVGLFYWRRGPLGSEVPDGGRLIERFTPFERSAHWANAIAFVVLAASGLVMAFGKFVLLPVLGGQLFGWLTYALKTVHNFVGPLFVVSLAIVFVTFVRDNLPGRGDLDWLRRGGGLFGGHEAPSHRFNAGEKLLFWGGVLALGAVVIGSGLVLDRLIPGWGITRGQMQVASVVHSVATGLMMAMFIGHIYIGSIGMKGAYQAMRRGYVDANWARAHHPWWYDDIEAGKIPAQRSSVRAPAPSAPAAGLGDPSAQA